MTQKRYHLDRRETANGLALDIQRHLVNETVVARPPSAAYKFQKAWRRNKVIFTSSAAVFAALLIGLFASMLSLENARQQEAKASQQERIAIRERDDAQEARLIAEEARDDANALREKAMRSSRWAVAKPARLSIKWHQDSSLPR